MSQGGRTMTKPNESLDKIALLRTIDPKERATIERRCQWRHAKAKEWLIERDDVGTDLYFLTSGAVRVLITPTPDREVILADINAGGYFGEMAAIDAALAKNPKLSANDMAAVKKARADGEAHHKAGKHAESIGELNKAKKALGL